MTSRHIYTALRNICKFADGSSEFLIAGELNLLQARRFLPFFQLLFSASLFVSAILANMQRYSNNSFFYRPIMQINLSFL